MLTMSLFLILRLYVELFPKIFELLIFREFALLEDILFKMLSWQYRLLYIIIYIYIIINDIINAAIIINSTTINTVCVL